MKKTSIRVRLMVIMIMLATLPVLLSTIVATNNIRNFSEKENISSNISRVQWGAQYLEELISQLNRMFYSLQINEQLIDGMGDLSSPDKGIQFRTQNYMSDTLSTAYYANSRKIDELILYVDENKKSFRVSYNVTGDILEIEQLTGYWARLQTSKTNIYFEQLQNHIYAVHSLNNFDNQKMFGGLAVKIKQDVWDELITILEPSREGEVYIFNDEMTLLKGSTKTENVDDIIRQIKANADIDYREGSLITTDKYYYFIHEVDGSKLLLVKAVPVALVKEGQIKTIQAGFMISILFVLISIVFSIIFSLRISRPIITLAKTMKKADVASLKVDTNQTIDEIDILEKGYNKMVTRLKELIEEEYQHEIELKNAQLLALQAQINPHFLNNTLNLIGGMALEKNAPQIYEVARGISEFLRYSVSISDDLVTIKDELTHVSNYLMIQQKRYEDRCHIKIDIEQGIETMKIPKFVLQPLIENAFEYGLQPKRGQWILLLKVFTRGNRIGILVKDNGVGMDHEKLIEVRDKLRSRVKQQVTDNKGIGIKNVDSRLKIIFGSRSGVRVFSKKDVGTMMLITIIRHEER